MNAKRQRCSSGVRHLDALIGDLFIGDNVIWYDDAGSLASVFCANLIRASRDQAKPMIYVTFDRSPRNLLDKLGDLARTPLLTILDCFTGGKGADSEVFLSFYGTPDPGFPCAIRRVENPGDTGKVENALYGIHADLEGDVRLVFESLTGMQELWGGEEAVIRFYARACPRLYELHTIAYWMIERRAHSPRMRAQINQIAQVAVELTVKRGKTWLTILKAEDRRQSPFDQPFPYWVRDNEVIVESGDFEPDRNRLGLQIRQIRTQQGISQTRLARQVGVTSSTISQVESGLIFPSLPALFKIAESLGVQAGALIHPEAAGPAKILRPFSEAREVLFPHMPKGSISGRRLVSLDTGGEVYLIEIPGNRKLPGHFFAHKGQEMGFVVSGAVTLTVENTLHTAATGDLIHLSRQIPVGWQNAGPEPCRLLWINLA